MTAFSKELFPVPLPPATPIHTSVNSIYKDN
jgi:hypothetical protein